MFCYHARNRFYKPGVNFEISPCGLLARRGKEKSSRVTALGRLCSGCGLLARSATMVLLGGPFSVINVSEVLGESQSKDDRIGHLNYLACDALLDPYFVLWLGTTVCFGVA